MKELDYPLLLQLNESSIQAGRRQNIRPQRLPSDLHAPYPINYHAEHTWEGQKDMRVCVVLTSGGDVAWLDISHEEFEAIPEVDYSVLDWEAALCPGTPPWVP
jgi:hypothetical protein